jgi:acyl-CoA synthetase (AMP-forming)/AMP-acid ligase II
VHPGTFAATTPDKPAVVMGASGRTVTYRQLHDEALRFAQLARSAGLEPGDHVAFCVENQPHFHAVAWGAHYAGLYYTAISTRLTAEEAAYIVDDCGARIFVTSAALAEMAEGLVERTPRVELRLMIDGTAPGHQSYEDAIAACPAEPLADAVAGRDMLYSSGTTGRPKGVKAPMSSDPVDTPTAVTGLCQLLFGVTDETVYLSPAPLYHSAPLRFSMAVQQLGGTVVVMEHFDPAAALELIERHRVTFSQWVPTMFIRMLKLPEAERTRHDLSSHQVAVHAAAPCPVEVKRRTIEWWGPILHEYYAGTEGNGFVYTNSTDWLAHPGTVGRNLTGEIHILDDEGRELPVGEAGTIWFGGTPEFEYHNDAAKTAESRDPRGWTTLGDVGRLDEDGFLYLTDRKAYMIISGGVNIYPQEAENLLAMHPKVQDVAVIGVPNDDFGEEVKAVVEVAPGVEPGPDLEHELIAYCREHLADVKCPRSVDFVDELPRHPTGKLYKRLLRDRYWSGHETSII